MPHASAKFNGEVIAETEAYEELDGNIYVSLLDRIYNNISSQVLIASAIVSTIVSHESVPGERY